MDVDVAEESTNLAKYSILSQASAAMLAQANTAPNTALMLLG
jgi:flagellin